MQIFLFNPRCTHEVQTSVVETETQRGQLTCSRSNCSSPEFESISHSMVMCCLNADWMNKARLLSDTVSQKWALTQEWVICRTCISVAARGTLSRIPISHSPLHTCHQHLPIQPALKVPACSPPLGSQLYNPLTVSLLVWVQSVWHYACFSWSTPFFPHLISYPVQDPIISEIFCSSKLTTNLSSLLRSTLMLWNALAFHQFLSWILFTLCLS